MGKIIFWLVVIFGVLLVVRLINVAKSKARAARASNRTAQPPAAMVRCVECGVFLPKAEARAVREGFHCPQPDCSQAHTAKR